MRIILNYDESQVLGAPKVFSNGNVVFNYIIQVCDVPKVILNGSIEFDDPKVFDVPQVFEDTKVISNGSLDFDNPEIYSDTSIFDGLVRNMQRCDRPKIPTMQSLIETFEFEKDSCIFPPLGCRGGRWTLLDASFARCFAIF